MRGIQGKTGWFWLFLIEGLLTFLIGAISFLYLPASPTSTKSVLYRRSWYTEREEVIMTNVRFITCFSIWMEILTPHSGSSVMTLLKVSLQSKNRLPSKTSRMPGATSQCGVSTSLASSPIFPRLRFKLI